MNTATQQTKNIKKIVAALPVRVRTDGVASMVTGTEADLTTAAAMLRAAGFDVLWFGSAMLSVAAD
jgi:hypothetical protein